MHGNFCIILTLHFFFSDFIDIDECKGNHSCHENANCTNTIGSHECNCQPGYTGNGQNCTGELDRFYLKRCLECALFCCKARRKQLEHEISVEINMRQNRGGFSSVLKTFVSAHVMIT